MKPYEEAKRFMRYFDVALIPHLDNEMTRSMNPLKAFVYSAEGVPVVSTPIANMYELGDLITVAKGVDGFIDAIEDVLAAERRELDVDALAPHTWERRVEQVITLIDEAAGVGETEVARAPIRRGRVTRGTDDRRAHHRAPLGSGATRTAVRSARPRPLALVEREDPRGELERGRAGASTRRARSRAASSLSADSRS